MARANDLAADMEDTLRGTEVERAPGRGGHAQHARRVEDLVGAQGRRAERGEVAVAPLDDLDGGEDLGDRLGGLLAGRGARGQVAAEADADLALDARVQEVREAELRAAGMHARARDEAGGGAGEAEIVLH